jgi:Uma2 family endonuclease
VLWCLLMAVPSGHVRVRIPVPGEQDGTTVNLQFDLPREHPSWELGAESMPESQPHDRTVELIKAILAHWAAKSGRSLQVVRNLAVRWVESWPAIGVDPDVCVIEPRTPEGDELTSLCTWLPGHRPPLLAVEVVSPSNAKKDYTIALDKYAASGVEEVWVFDPKRSGPGVHGGPFVLQIWRRDEDGLFSRRYAGSGPAESAALRAWVVVTEEGRLRVAADREGRELWPTAAEAERAAKEAALARIAELERALAGRRGADGAG